MAWPPRCSPPCWATWVAQRLGVCPRRGARLCSDASPVAWLSSALLLTLSITAPAVAGRARPALPAGCPAGGGVFSAGAGRAIHAAARAVEVSAATNAPPPASTAPCARPHAGRGRSGCSPWPGCTAPCCTLAPHALLWVGLAVGWLAIGVDQWPEAQAHLPHLPELPPLLATLEEDLKWWPRRWCWGAAAAAGPQRLTPCPKTRPRFSANKGIPCHAFPAS